MHALKERGSDKASKTGRTCKTIPTPSQGLNRTAPATHQKGSRTNKNSSQLKSGSSRPSQTDLDQEPEPSPTHLPKPTSKPQPQQSGSSRPQPLLIRYKVPKRPASPFEPDLLPRLKKLKFRPEAIAEKKSIMDVLDRKELGRQLAAYIRELADPNMPRRYSG